MASLVSTIPAAFLWRNRIAFLLVGFITNFHYCLILSGSESLAEQFGLKRLTALVSWCNVLGGIVVKSLNAFRFNRVNYNVRFFLAGLQTAIGIVAVCLSPVVGASNGVAFALLLLGVLCVGNGSAYGESVNLGYMERFDAGMIGWYSSGTGFSGVLGSLVYLGLKNVPGFHPSDIFACSIPFVFGLFVLYYSVIAVGRDSQGNVVINGRLPWTSSSSAALVRGGGSHRRGAILSSPTPPSPIALADPSHPGGAAVSNAATPAGQQHESVAGRMVLWLMPDLPLQQLKQAHRLVFWQCLQLLLVYVFEYGVQMLAPFAFPPRHAASHPGGGSPPSNQTGSQRQMPISTTTMPPASTLPPAATPPPDFFLDNAFIITQLCYQVGVLMSRSSLAVVRVRRVAVLSMLQFVNFVLWIVQAKTLVLSAPDDPAKQRVYCFILFGHMIFVGLLGGASYANVFYNILHDILGDASKATQGGRAATVAAEAPTHSVGGVSGIGAVVLTEATIQAAGADAGDVPSGNDAEAQSLLTTDDERAAASRRRELCMNVGALYANVGITLGSLLDVILANTLISHS